MSAQPAARGTPGIDSWIVVDLDRIIKLPERLRRLWPPDLLPHRTDEKSAAASAKAGRSGTEAAAGGGPDSTASAKAGNDRASSVKAGKNCAPSGRDEADDGGGAKRELDVLTAWVRGFASELDRVNTRISVVISSGCETVHLALCLGPGVGQAILALEGDGLEDFAQHQLLSRIEPGRIGHVVEDLAELVEHDCVLTLSWAAGAGATGLEFLHRKDGAWFRPVIDRAGESVTVDDDVAAGDAAVRMLLSTVLTRTLTVRAWH